MKNKLVITEHFLLKNELYMFRTKFTKLIRTYILIVSLTFISCKNGESVFSRSKNNRPSPPTLAFGTIDGVDIRIDYSSPKVKKREIWGELVPYNRLWRTGANEATIVFFSKNILLNNQEIPAGKYSFFTIPGKNDWTLILNKQWDLWGSYDYQEKNDLVRISVQPYELDKHSENLTFLIENHSIEFKWEKLGFKIPVNKK